jgi:hypothetical protein
MSFSTVLTIAGLLLTAVLGIWSIYLAIKRRYAGEITFVQEYALGLFDSMVKNFPDLSIKFKRKSIGESLVLLKGYLVNTGSKDITPEMVAEPIRIKLPEGYRWLTAKIVESSPSVQASVGILDKTHLSFDMGMFRCDEYIRFECVSESPIHGEAGLSQINAATNFLKSMKFAHRIADTAPIRWSVLTTEGKPSELTILMKICVMVILVAAFSLAFGYSSYRDNRFKVHYFLSSNGAAFEVNLNSLPDGQIQLKGVVSSYDETVPSSELFRKPIEAKVGPGEVDSARWAYFAVPAVLLVAGMSYAVYLHVLYGRQKRLWKILLTPKSNRT